MSERAQVLEPDNFGHAASISDSYIRWRGDLDAARRALPDNPVEPGPMYHFGRLWLLFAERDYAAALKHAEQLDNFGPFFQNLGSYFVGVIQYQAEGRENARKNLDSTVRLLRGRIETSPSNYLMHSFLGLTYAMLGMDQEAVREVKLAMDLTAKDAFVNPRMRENLAIVYATIGRHDDAIDLIEQLLSEESTAPVTIPYLRLVPFWDPLRDNPRFQALVASNEGT